MRRLVTVAGTLILGAWCVQAVAQEAKAIELGKQVYAEQKCKLCHSIAGEGNTKGPLDGVGSKLTTADIREWMSACGVTLACSTQPESFGRTALEAIKLGKPVIGYNHGGVGEVLAKVFPEGLVPANDWRAMGERIVEFAKAPPLVRRTKDFTLRAMQERNHVSVFLDPAGFFQVRQQRLFVAALFHCPRELRRRHDGNIKFLCQYLQASGDLCQLHVSLIFLFICRCKLDVIHNHQIHVTDPAQFLPDTGGGDRR